MERFKKAVNKTRNFEGGYINHPSDYGGETKYGISKKSYPNIDIKNLTIDEAELIYKKEYWDSIKLDSIINQEIAEELFDTAVNMGCRRAISFLQRSLNALGITPELIVDSIIGNKTINATNSYKYPKVLIKALNGFQISYYILRVESDPTQKVFFRGWIMNRVNF